MHFVHARKRGTKLGITGKENIKNANKEKNIEAINLQRIYLI